MARNEEITPIIEVYLVPSPACERVGCEVARMAVELVAEVLLEVAVVEAVECPKGARQFVVAVEGSSRCSAESALRAHGVKPSVVISAATILAKRGLVHPGMEVRTQVEMLAKALAEEIDESLRGVLEEARERRAYQEAIGSVMQRFKGVWEKLEAMPPPNGKPEEQQKGAVDLLAKRARNLFMKMDESPPPAQWAEPHDLFQDALLCIAYAAEGWAAGDAERWEQNIEKARVQIKPLLRRLGG